jgi:hypothetical protein
MPPQAPGRRIQPPFQPTPPPPPLLPSTSSGVQSFTPLSKATYKSPVTTISTNTGANSAIHNTSSSNTTPSNFQYAYQGQSDNPISTSQEVSNTLTATDQGERASSAQSSFPRRMEESGEVAAYPTVNNTLQPRSSCVFYCKNCRTIVGDSLSYATDYEDRLIGLTSVTNVSITGTEPQISREGFDQGSTFFLFICNQCQCKLGKQYKTTNSAMDDFRNLWCLMVDWVGCYVLGSCIPDTNPLEAEILPTCKSLGDEIAQIQLKFIDMAKVINSLEALPQTVAKLERQMEVFSEKLALLTEQQKKMHIQEHQINILRLEKEMKKESLLQSTSAVTDARRASAPLPTLSNKRFRNDDTNGHESANLREKRTRKS